MYMFVDTTVLAVDSILLFSCHLRSAAGHVDSTDYWYNGQHMAAGRSGP